MFFTEHLSWSTHPGNNFTNTKKKEVEFIIIERWKSLLSCDHHVKKLMQLKSTVKWDCSTSEKLHDFKIQEEEGVKGKEEGRGTSHITRPNSSF